MLGVLAAALMAASFFMPWVSMFGQDMGPQMLIGENAPGVMDLPWQALAFLASFALAALASVMAVLQQRAGVLMLLAGGTPFAVIAHGMLSMRSDMGDIDLPMPQISGGDMGQMLDLARDVLSIGAPVYILSALVLVVVGLARVMRGQ